MIKRAYLVETAKGDAVFLDESRAMEYAQRYRGIMVKMYGQTFGESYRLEQTGDGVVICDQQLHADASNASDVCNADGHTSESVSSC